MSERVTIEPDISTDLRTVASATKLAEVYRVTRRDGTPLSTNQEIDLFRNAIVGALVSLWGHAQKHIRDDNTLALASQAVDALVHLEGFSEAVSRQWLDELDGGRGVKLPGYREKNALVAMGKRAIKPEPSQARPLHSDDYSPTDSVYSTHRDDYIPNSAPKANNSQHSQSLGVASGDSVPMFEVSLPSDMGWKGEQGSKSKRGCGGERERGEGGETTYLPTMVATGNGRKPPRRTLSPLPHDFALTEPMRAYAQQRMEDCDVAEMFEQFVAHHRAHGKQMKDWVAAWRTWVGNALRFGYPRLVAAKGRKGLPVLNG